MYRLGAFQGSAIGLGGLGFSQTIPEVARCERIKLGWRDTDDLALLELANETGGAPAFKGVAADAKSLCVTDREQANVGEVLGSGHRGRKGRRHMTVQIYETTILVPEAVYTPPVRVTVRYRTRRLRHAGLGLVSVLVHSHWRPTDG